MFKPWSQVSYRARDLRVDRIFLTARRRRMVGLVEDQQRSGLKRPQPIA